MLSQSSSDPEAWIFFFCLFALFLLGKNVLTVMVSGWINNGVFEPSYSDLKFMVETAGTCVPT